MFERNGSPGDDIGSADERLVLGQVVEVLRAAGYYAYLTVDSENRWTVACDTEDGHVDVRVGDDGYALTVWDTSPGLFWEEDERRRAARERLARISLPAIARGFLGPGQETWWDEADHGVGVRLDYQVPFGARDRLGEIAQERLEELNHLIAFVEERLSE